MSSRRLACRWRAARTGGEPPKSRKGYTGAVAEREFPRDGGTGDVWPPHAARSNRSGCSSPSQYLFPGKPLMADTESVVAASPVSEEDLARAEEFTREPFLHEGEEA